MPKSISNYWQKNISKTLYQGFRFYNFSQQTFSPFQHFMRTVTIILQHRHLESNMISNLCMRRLKMTYQCGIGRVWPECLWNGPVTDWVAFLSRARDIDQLPTVVPAVVRNGRTGHRRVGLLLLLHLQFDCWGHVYILILWGAIKKIICDNLCFLSEVN